MAIKTREVGLCEARRTFEQSELAMRESAKGRRKRGIKASAITHGIKRAFKPKDVNYGD